MGKKSFLSLLAAALLVAASLLYPRLNGEDASGTGTQGADYTVYFPSSRFPETGKHIREAMEAGEPSVCTIDRDGAEENRKESLEGVPTKKGYDRDEWPMAMCEEGGAGADIAYVPPSDNRGAGSWIGNRLEELPDGTRVEFIIK